MSQNPSNDNVSFFSRFIATGFLSGYSPVIPGTTGSLVGLALYFIPGIEQPLTFLLTITSVFMLGVYTSHQMEKKFGNDPSIVVIDEIVGMWISLFMLPKNILVGTMAFLLFRVYDIIKPPPARKLEHQNKGWGIMLDDVAAGIYANVTMRILILLFPAIK